MSLYGNIYDRAKEFKHTSNSQWKYLTLFPVYHLLSDRLLWWKEPILASYPFPLIISQLELGVPVVEVVMQKLVIFIKKKKGTCCGFFVSYIHTLFNSPQGAFQN